MSATTAIPVFRYRQQLERCLASVRGQTVRVFDSGGDAETMAACLKAGVPHERIQTANMIESWNEAVRRCESEWVHVLHDDDFVRPDFHKALHAAMAADVFVCGYENETDGLVSFSNRPFGCIRGIVDPAFVRERLCEGNGTVPSAIAFRKSVWEQVGGFENVGALDWHFLLKAVVAGARFWSEPEYLVRREEHKQSDGGMLGAPGRYESILRTIREGERMGLCMDAARRNYLHQASQEALVIGQHGQKDLACETFLAGVGFARKP